MLDLNTIITQALTTIVINAINEQTKPLVDRITGLESQADEDMARIAVLEQRITDTENKLTNTRALLLELSNRIAAWQDTQVEQTNLLPIEQRVYTVDQVKAIVSQEVHAAIEHHLEQTPHMTEDEVGEAIDDKIGDHCNDYDHDQFLTEIDSDEVYDAVSNCLRDATIRLG